jgi:hypothetical protein
VNPTKRALLVLAIALTVVVGILAGFGLPLFAKTPAITLPNAGGEAGLDNPAAALPGGSGAEPALVRVTQDTVQAVVASLTRPASFYRETRTELFWREDTGETQSAVGSVLIWQDGGYTKTTLLAYDGSLQNSLAYSGKVYVWYGGEKTYYTYDADSAELDLIQRSPTYEDVLSLPRERITGAGYEEKNDRNCIFVEVEESDLGYRERFWIAVDSGLLVAAETERGGSLLYRMEETLFSDIAAHPTLFELPSGGVGGN